MTACPLCRSVGAALVTDHVRFGRRADVLRCLGCSLVFLDQSSFEFPADFYQREYHQTYLSHVDPDVVDPEAYFKKMSVASRPWINRIRDLLSGSERVLDVGCSTGHVLAGLQDRAGAVFGHELNAKEVAFAQQRVGLNVASTPLHERFQRASFDMITLVFVLEHIGEPVEFLTYLGGFLKRGGRLVIVVPNVQDALLNLYDIPAFASFYYCIEHLYYYSPKTLGATLERAGYSAQIECVQEYPLANHLHWLLRQQPSETLAARRAAPAGLVTDAAFESEWDRLWSGFDASYRDFLMRLGMSDRVWAIAQPK